MFEKDGFSRVSQIAKNLGVAKSTIWRWSKKQDFPKSVKLSAGITVWSNNELNKWVENQKNQLQGTF